MEHDDSYDKTQDNTKVMRIMSGFQDFMSTQKSASLSQNLYEPHLSNIPFHCSGDKVNTKAITNHSKDATAQQMLNIDLQVKIKRLEIDHASEKKALVQENIRLQALYEERNAEMLKLKERFDLMTLKNKQLTEQNIDMIDKVKMAEKQRDDDVMKWESNYKELEKLKQEVEERILNEFSSQRLINQSLMEENNSLKSQLNNASFQLEEAYANVELLKERANESHTVMQKLSHTESELIKATQQIHELSERLSQAEEAERTVKCFKEDMMDYRLLKIKYRKLSETNAMLKEKQSNSLLLGEKLKSAEAKLSRAEENCSQVYMLEAINESLASKLERIENQRTSLSEVKNLEHQVYELNNHIKLLQDKISSIESDNNITHEKYVAEKETVAQLREKISKQQEIAAFANSQLLRLKKRASLLARERDSIRDILQSYDAELTMTSHTTQLSKRLANEEEANAKLHNRIEQLESELQKNTEECMRLRLVAKQLEGKARSENASFFQQPSTDPVPTEINDFKDQVANFEKERSELLDKIGNLEAWIEQRKMKGDYNPENTKVIHFSMNPADLAHQKSKQDLANLKEENANLKKKILELQEGHEVSISEIEVPQNIKDQLSMAELRNQRLKEIFSKKIQEFRQACYSLTGFRIDASTDSKFKLVSMYADSQSDYLLFEMTPDGEMQLLETEYSKSLQDLISLHLHHQNSIPMFLSAISVNLFSQQTMLGD